MEIKEKEPATGIFPVIVTTGSSPEVSRVLAVSVEDGWLHDKGMGLYRFKLTDEEVTLTELDKAVE